MLALKDIYFHPATSAEPILKGITFQASIGKPVLISGVSGSGKTSLIEVISGLSRSHRGQVFWQGKVVKDRQRKFLCGVVFQFPERYFLGLTVGQELKLGHRRLDSESQFKVLRKVGLPYLDLRTAPEKLSGGQQRRLAIAIQLLRKPRILLLDEPTAGLDWSVRTEILSLLTELAKDQILITVTHEPELFKEWSLSSFELNNGFIDPLV